MVRNKKGFTLIELLATLIVLAVVIGLVITIALRIITRSKESSYQVTVKNIESNANVEKIKIDYKVTNFTKLNFKADRLPSYNTLFVKSADGNIYDVSSGLAYDPNIILLFDNILVYSDKSISSVYGDKFTDENGNYYKIKYAFFADDNEDYSKKFIIIVTDDERVIIMYSSDLFSESYESLSKIKNVEFNGKGAFDYGNLVITYDDESKVNFKAMCSTYFCIE